MSFILDALRKSEHERQRSSMPGIAQVPFGLPRREMPRWAIGVIVVLALAVLALGGAWWSTIGRDSGANPEASAAARSETPLTLPPAAVAVPPRQAYSAPPLPERNVEPSEPASRRSTEPAASNSRTDAAVADVRNEARGDEPAAAPETSETLTLPSAAALAAQGVTLPALRLELHAYSPRPADRFVFINGTKYVEGATLAEGPRLISIAPNGAVLAYLSHRFLLAPQ